MIYWYLPRPTTSGLTVALPPSLSKLSIISSLSENKKKLLLILDAEHLYYWPLFHSVLLTVRPQITLAVWSTSSLINQKRLMGSEIYLWPGLSVVGRSVIISLSTLLSEHMVEYQHYPPQNIAPASSPWNVSSVMRAFNLALTLPGYSARWMDGWIDR